MKKFILSLTSILLFTTIYGQNDTQVIELKNPSFEGNARVGQPPLEWLECDERTESTPDIHSRKSNFFSVATFPYDGLTYLGMVTRVDNTWESISQRLRDSIIESEVYSFSLYLARSENYVSAVGSKQSSILNINPNEKINYNIPVVLRIWGGDGYCDKIQLLHETSTIKHSEWKEYKIIFQPEENFSHISLEAFYDVNYGESYCGNLLIDNCSSIRKIASNKKRLVNFDLFYRQKKLNQFFQITTEQDIYRLITDLKSLDLNKVALTLEKMVDIFNKIEENQTLSLEDSEYYGKAEEHFYKSMEEDTYKPILEEYLEN